MGYSIIRRLLRLAYRLSVALSAVVLLVTLVLWVLSYTSTIWVLNYSSHVREPSIQTSGYQIDIDSRYDSFYLRAYPIPDRWTDMQSQLNPYRELATLYIPVPFTFLGSLQVYAGQGRWYYYFWIRYAHLAILAAILPGLWLWQRLRDRRLENRVKRGLCRECGYDLRATPDRCPECGTAVTPSRPTRS